ncbi:TPA: hypothetical protein MYL62_005572 [Klebsiella variicola subsp. variicola]|nr:hypothetical protein [Klebsiella pneumoniae]HCB0130944.1 hypothetical protein [Klebsiella variicola subsp. variicola]HBZ9143553.1 hypothetical protein [Klebsiella pneumoniae]HBZ9994673.1 hypothetical protein [Klebsiella pneumoniae]HCA0137201.1 hypothetical protein [Klebsiella pneumoniae]
MTLQAVNELIASLESAGELSIRETKVMALAKAYQQLAAENVALKQYALDCVNAVENWNSWADKEDQIHNDIETPATDRIVSGIKADGVEEFIGRLQQHVDEGDFVGDEVDVIVGAIDCGKEFCEQLREGADK